MKRQAIALATLLASIALAGCTMAGPANPGGPESAACHHPYPCTQAWPVGLEGPFDLLERTEVLIPSHDGVMLHAWLWRPSLPDGVGAPTILMSTPYLAAEDGQSQMEQLYEPPILRQYVPNGFAYLVAEVRGTGASGGCFGHHDLDAQKDPAALVEWVAHQAWSNGRVGMAGMSYMGVSAIHGAIHAGPALKAVAPVAVPQQYLYHFTPQGAFSTSAAGYELTQHTLETPPLALGNGPGPALSSVLVVPERWCDEYARNMLVEPSALLLDDRDADFWTIRDSFASYQNITAATFLSEGFNDPYIPWGQDVAWDLLTAPKRILFGQWGHEMPPLEDTGRQRLAWFQYWLQGLGEAPRIGTVDFQDDAGAWHNSTAWPPTAAKLETLYLRPGQLAVNPDEGSASYRSAPIFPGRSLKEQLCAPTDALRFDGPTLQTPATLAGNPHAWITVESSNPMGLIGAYLYRAPGGDCQAATLLTSGAVDLRFHAGNLVAEDFPVDTPTQVRIDFEMIAATLAPGDQMLLLVTYPGPYDDRDLDDPERVQPHGPGSAGRTGQTALGQITIKASDNVQSSHLRIPMLAGTLGGQVIDVAYPPRPFAGQG